MGVQSVWHKARQALSNLWLTSPAITKKNALNEVFPNSWRPEQPAKTFLSGCCVHLMKAVHLYLLCSAES
jgi:hypothetical protein